RSFALLRRAVADALAAELHVHRVARALHHHAQLAIVGIAAEGDRAVDDGRMTARTIHLVGEPVARALALEQAAVALLGDEVLVLLILGGTQAAGLRRHSHRHARHLHPGRDFPQVVLALCRRR